MCHLPVSVIASQSRLLQSFQIRQCLRRKDCRRRRWRRTPTRRWCLLRINIQRTKTEWKQQTTNCEESTPWSEHPELCQKSIQSSIVANRQSRSTIALIDRYIITRRAACHVECSVESQLPSCARKANNST